jgi:cytosine deaminase
MHPTKKARLDPSLGTMIRNVALVGRDGTWDIMVSQEGTIKTIEPAQPRNGLPNGMAEYDGLGRVAIPGLVDAHIHLDKAYLLDRCTACRGDFPEALSETLRAKKSFTMIDVRARARKLIQNEIGFGTTLLRTHVEVDPIANYESLDAILPLRKEFANSIDIQVCVFAQEGITNIDGQMEMMRESLRRGCDVVGSAPYCDSDPVKNIELTFDLAQEFNVPVDFHLDYHLEGKPSYLQNVIDETIKRGYQGKVCLGHMTYLSTLSNEELQKVGKQLADAGISVLCLPASDLCMMARGDDGNQRRGVAPVHKLNALGATAAFATNNVQNLFTFTGDGDVLKIGTLVCQVLQLTSESNTQLCVDMATTHAAKALGVEGHAIAVGSPADMVILASEGPSSMQLLAAPPVERTVIKRGRIVSETLFQRKFHF